MRHVSRNKNVRNENEKKDVAATLTMQLWFCQCNLVDNVKGKRRNKWRIYEQVGKRFSYGVILDLGNNYTLVELIHMRRDNKFKVLHDRRGMILLITNKLMLGWAYHIWLDQKPNTHVYYINVKCVCGVYIRGQRRSKTTFRNGIKSK